MRKSALLVFALAVLSALWTAYTEGPAGAGQASDFSANESSARNSTVRESTAQDSSANDAILERAFVERRGNLQVEGGGTVVHILADDNRGSRHQRFLLELDSGLTLLVAHNIDLAPRVANLAKGDRLHFFGEYEWNDKGGVIHWTHHAPRGDHVAGWLEHEGRRYQ